ncbi:HlyD family efflux transporter periplasmic adaptor subunit [Falsigemmobacter intermedius]|uniref:HlyD family efflux transporter periplasmic adaptor subunit n=2 Tax=Falsigemmobacter intermedius TaxID=1553448 RepID=A0A3S3TZ04_9RHOB|nr:HlyD family efflux transporter periplasmic adaptor subunit [Falsigemmobacter intermedius]
MITRTARRMMWTCILVVACFLGWASLARIDEVTRGEGRVIPLSRLQRIQSLEGGILETMLVQEGDIVEAGQPLLQLDDTRFAAAFLEGQAQARSLRAAIARLAAEARGEDHIYFSEGVPAKSPEALDEQALFDARRNNLRERSAALTSELDIAKRQLSLLEPLVQRGAVSEMDLLRLRQDTERLRGELTELLTSYTQDAYTELSARKAELGALEQSLRQREDQLRRTEIVSPVRGMVNNILVTTRGGVIQPGEAIMEILPLDEQLLIEAKVRPQDVAFLAVGMTARVKITAYDYSVYGDLTGRLEQISADTIEETTLRGKEVYYQILLRTESNALQHNGQILPIRPGMIAEVDIINGNRPVISYLLRPILKARLN